MTEVRHVDLFRGYPCKELLPKSLLLKASEDLLSNPDVANEALIYGENAGFPPLLERIAPWLAEFYQTPQTTSSRLTITGGASASIGNILQTFTDPAYTKAVFMIAPTYFLASRIFEDHGFAGRLRAVPEDEEGINIPYLDRLLREYRSEENQNVNLTKEPGGCQKHYQFVMYCVPTFANPSGKIMSLRRRKQLIRLARKYDMLIISDDVYDFLNWSSEVPGKSLMPRLVDIDYSLDGGPATPHGNAVSNGSFSKILGPGLRTGWTESTETFATGLSICGATISGGGASSQMCSGIIWAAFENGSLQKFLLDTLIPAYQQRSAATLAAVQKYLVPLGATVENTLEEGRIIGGYYVYVRLPRGLQSSHVSDRASNYSVIFGTGEVFQVGGDEKRVPIRDTMRICFASEEIGAIVEGIQRLGTVVGNLVGEATDESTDASSDGVSDCCSDAALPSEGWRGP